MNERVTMQRLEELIQQLRADFDIAGESRMPEAVAALGKISDLGKALYGLQSLRQASVAGVEEAAERIAKRISEYPHPVFAAPAIIRMELAALLAERDAVLRECKPILRNLYNAGVQMHFTHGDSSFEKSRDGRRDDLRAMESLLNRIDAILGKEGDGGS